jgi:phosphoribosylanthranilate isomerase
MPLIKICGIGGVLDAVVAAEAGATFVGVVHASASPRFLDPTSAAELVDALPPVLQSVGVFVDPSAEEIARTNAVVIQLHGEETPKVVSALAATTIKPLIKGFPFDVEACRVWDNHEDVDFLLIDGPRAGSGEAFDHAHLAEVIATLSTPVILAGGLDPDNVARVLEEIMPYAVDVSSGVERERGTKDHGLIRAFCEAVLG